MRAPGRKFYQWAAASLLVWAIALSIVIRWTVIPSTATFWESVSIIQTDRYLFIFGVLPAWLAATVATLAAGIGEPELIRYGSMWRYVLSRCLTFLHRAALFSLAPLAGGLIASWGLAGTLAWNGKYTDEISAAFANGGFTPLTSLAMQPLLATGSLTLLAALLVIVSLRCRTATGIVAAACMVYVVLLAALNLGAPVFGGIFLLHTSPSPTAAIATICALGLVLLGLVLGTRWLETRGRSSLSTALGHLVPPSVILAALVTHAFTLAQFDDLTFARLLEVSFGAGTPDVFVVTGFLTYALVYIGGALLIGVRTARAEDRRLELEAVRYGRLDRWWWVVVRRVTIESLALTVYVALAAGAIAMLGGSDAFASAGHAVLVTLVTGIPQLVLMALLFAGVSALAHDARFIAGMGVVTLVASLPMVNQTRALPFGLSLFTHGGSGAEELVLACVYVAALATALWAMSRTARFPALLLERNRP